MDIQYQYTKITGQHRVLWAKYDNIKALPHTSSVAASSLQRNATGLLTITPIPKVSFYRCF